MVVGDFWYFFFLAFLALFSYFFLVFLINCGVLLVVDVHFGWLVGIAGGIGWKFDDFFVIFCVFW